jgi:hypothetical protein
MNILAKFRNRPDLIEYTTAILNYLITDPDTEYIINAETGELIYHHKMN